MTKKDILAILKTAISLFLICAVAAGAVAAVNAVTKDTIAANSAAAANEAKSAVLPEAASFEDVTLGDGAVGYIGKTADGTVAGYVFNTAASGYGGKLDVMTGFSADGAVTGVAILSIEETPGLGMNAKRDSFLSQFTGTNGDLTVIKNAEPGENEILALTSATITSRAMVKAVNAARAYYTEVSGKGE
jgi:electron transport complex protein RnfG